ncbi:uncharacterized protein C6orf132 homolog [Bombina bombina]|uniref:uncharacterized protein C6orf132 homolog n=1 Tax=Bombina bombina TaxID=8345 RepID=UPI00235ADE2B|nr:uncharacterized protein C6orf132 homolog [Bombina bombina]
MHPPPPPPQRISPPQPLVQRVQQEYAPRHELGWSASVDDPDLMPPALQDDTWQDPWPEDYSFGLEGEPSQPRRVDVFTPPHQYQASQGLYHQAEWVHTSRQWDYQSIRRSPPSASLGRAPASEEEHIAVSIPQAAPPVIIPQAAPAVIPQAAPAVIPQAAPAVIPQAAPAVIPQAAPAVIPQAAPAVIQQAAPAVIHQAAPAAEDVQVETAARGEPAPRIPAGEEPLDPLTSAMGDKYIALQRRQTSTCERLTSTCERMQRDQRRFYRNQQTLLQRSIELQRDMAASLSCIVQNQSQIFRTCRCRVTTDGGNKTICWVCWWSISHTSRTLPPACHLWPALQLNHRNPHNPEEPGDPLQAPHNPHPRRPKK